MSTFDTLVADLTRDVHRVQPKDALQFCANWFQSRLEEQRARIRDVLVSQRSHPSYTRNDVLPPDFYVDTPLDTGASAPSVSPFSQALPRPRSSLRNSVSHSPFGTLNVPGNALLSDDNQSGGNIGPPTFKMDARELPPTSPLSMSNTPYTGFDNVTTPTSPDGNDYLHAPSSNIFARRTSVSAESIIVDSSTDEPLPVYPKTEDQLRRIRASISHNFIFRDLDEEQALGVLNAMQERETQKDEVVIRQGDVGDYFYVVESGELKCYVHPDPLPPTWFTDGWKESQMSTPQKFLQPKHHPVFGREVTVCKPGDSFGELALMHGHPRAASVVAVEPSTLWSLDRITFRTIILKAAHRRRTMYEQFLSSVTLLSSLEPEERSKIADALVSSVYNDEEAVVRQGEMGDTFFFVEEGEAAVTKIQVGDDGETREINVGHLTKGDYFGELSLLRLAPRAATVSAVHRGDHSLPRLKVAALDAPSFTRLLGPLREIMERQAGTRYGPRLSR